PSARTSVRFVASRSSAHPVHGVARGSTPNLGARAPCRACVLDGRAATLTDPSIRRGGARGRSNTLVIRRGLQASVSGLVCCRFAMHFGPYTLERQLAGSERVGRFVASRPEADGTKSVLTVDIPTPEARRDPAFLRDFEACIGATLGLDHPHLLPPLEHGVDEGVPYLAHAHISGLTLAEIDTALRLEGTPWFAEVVTFILHRVAMACRYLAQYVGLPRDVEASHVVLGDAGEVYVDAFVLLGGWTGIQPGHADIPDVLRRLGASLHGGLPPELAPLLATWSNVPATWLTELEAHVSAEAQTLLAETVRALLAARPEPADVTTDAPPSDQNDDIPVRRRFRRTQLAPVPNSS